MCARGLQRVCPDAGGFQPHAGADAFGGKFVGDALKADIEKRLKEIKEKYKEPPPEKARSPRSDQRRMKPKHREARWRDKNRRKKRSAR